MKTVTALLLLAAVTLGGCASSSPASRNDGIARSSGVIVFGTIDAGVSRTDTKR
jgi:ABC-type amino acid transport substrate-binding protein